MINNVDKFGENQYLDLLKDVQENGILRPNRTGTDTIGLFGAQTRYKLEQAFPLLTTKKVFLKAVIVELLWLLKGATNIKFLQDHDVHIWDEWADENGDLGEVYGKQWRAWEATDGRIIDQITEVIAKIKTTPNDRRLIVSAWNVGEISKMALPPCHCFFQFFVADGKLSCQLYQRSADLFLGVPFNIASYAILTKMVAQVTGLEVGDFIHTFGDYHIYTNHFDQVNEQLSRDPYPFPQLKLNPDIKDIFDFKLEDFKLEDYQCHPAIKAKVAV